MENLKIYEIENSYIDHLVPFAPHLFHNKKENQENERKYIGIILTVNGLDYFAPLSSFKEKHKKMKNGNSPPLAKRCNDFKLLEEKCKEYSGKCKN